MDGLKEADLNDPRAAFMVDRLRGYLLSGQAATLGLPLRYSIVKRDGSPISRVPPSLMPYLNLYRMALLFMRDCVPVLLTLVQRAEVYSRSLTRRAARTPWQAGKLQRNLDEHPAGARVMSAEDRAIVMRTIVELQLHLEFAIQLTESSEIDAVQEVRERLRATFIGAHQMLKTRTSDLEGIGFGSVADAREDLGAIRSDTAVLLGAPSGRVVDNAGAYLDYARTTAHLFRRGSRTPSPTDKLLSWRNEMLRCETSLSAGIHIADGAPRDLGDLYRLWCFVEIGIAFLDHDQDSLTRALAVRSVRRSGPSEPSPLRDFAGSRVMGYSSQQNLGVDSADIAVLAKGSARSALPGRQLDVVGHTRLDGWSTTSQLQLIGATADSGARVGLLLVGDVLPEAPMGIAPDARDLDRCRRLRVGSSSIMVAALVPEESSQSLNEEVLRAICELVSD